VVLSRFAAGFPISKLHFALNWHGLFALDDLLPKT
jgi:hypothetical protein